MLFTFWEILLCHKTIFLVGASGKVGLLNFVWKIGQTKQLNTVNIFYYYIIIISKIPLLRTLLGQSEQKWDPGDSMLASAKIKIAPEED